MPDIWPPLPIVISHCFKKTCDDSDNIIAALEHNNRICELAILRISSSQFEKVLAAMQKPFPELTYLELWLEDETAPVDPDLFLCGSAPALQKLCLECFSFPRLPKLLLSATHLVELSLTRLPHSGYISPDAMATCLSVLTNLESLLIEFESPRSRPDRRNRRPPPTRTLLPVLNNLWFKGVSDYLEDFLARIDAPLLNEFWIRFFHQLIFDTSQFAQFIYRTPKFKAHDELQAHVNFSDSHVRVRTETFGVTLDLEITCGQSDWQLSSLAQVCSSSFLMLAVEYLYFEDAYLSPYWQDDIESSQWLELLHPFITVKGLYVSRDFFPRIAPALGELTGERVREVLPALQTVFLDRPLPSGPVQEAIGRFVAARQLSGHPIAISEWGREED
jgi:hypothetical protein